MTYDEAMQVAVTGGVVFRSDFYPLKIIHLNDDDNILRLGGFFIVDDSGDSMTSYIPADIDITATDWSEQ